jgi:D-beta-D-heptose 7-phosphate kinase / D-beta-D-heptose 1-phosphate adenosyltransferase
MNIYKLEDLIDRIKRNRPKVLVMGDIMLDEYIKGDVERISPEAPVPILSYNNTKKVLGGAGNVVHNLVNIGARSGLLSFVGYDDGGELIKKLLSRLELYEDILIQTDNIKTTRKTRFLSNGSHLLRLDIDSSGFKDLDYKMLRDRAFESISKHDIIIISDYNKGVCLPHLMQNLIVRANSQNIPIFIDPKGKNWDKYLNATCLTPNTKETETYLNRTLKSDSDFEKAAREIKNSLNLKFFLITRGSDGMTCYDGNNIIHQKVSQKEVFDVSGAGDTVIASLAASFCSGFKLKDCLELSSVLSSEVIAYSGTTPFDTSMLKK